MLTYRRCQRHIESDPGLSRPSGYGYGVAKCHEYHSIDLAWLRRKKLFNVGHLSTLTWSRAGRETAISVWGHNPTRQLAGACHAGIKRSLPSTPYS